MAKTKDQCTLIEGIVTEYINQQFSKIKQIDEDTSIIVLGKSYIEDATNWLFQRQSDAIVQFNTYEEAVGDFVTNQTANFSKGQTKYYKALLKMLETSRSEGVSYRNKYSLTGILMGGVISCGYIILKYLFDASIKTENDVSDRYSIPVLKTIIIEGNHYLFVDRMVRWLRNIPHEDRETALSTAATDVGILMNKGKAKNLYIVKTDDSNYIQEVAEALQKKLITKDPSLSVTIGTPESDPDNMVRFSENESVVLIAETRKTKTSSFDKCYEMINRYNSDVLGAIVLKEA